MVSNIIQLPLQLRLPLRLQLLQKRRTYLLLLCLTKRSYLEQMPKTVPILFAAGAEDPVGNYGKGVEKVRDAFLELGMQDVECILYPEDRHEIFNELDREKVYEDVGGWILKKLQEV